MPRRLELLLLALVSAGCFAERDKTSAPALPGSAPTAAPATRSPDSSARQAPTAKPASDWSELPVVAIWRQHGGHPRPGGPFAGPALRVALWQDGRIVFAVNRASWEEPLRQGRIDATRLKTILRAVSDTGVFELPGTTYLVPDAPVLVTLVRVGERQQILYWDEVEAKNYGINIQPKPHHLAFKKTWHTIDKILADSVPRESSVFSGAFQPPPSWYVKSATQSE